MTRRRMLLACALAVFGVSCMKVDEAADPVWGKEPCAHCRMLVGDRRYAAQVVSDGERRHFDDVGCLVLWLEERRGGPAPRVWVRDAEASRWVDARSARYEPGAKTPMDFGFEARSGGALAWDDMRARVLAKRRAP